MYATDLKVKRSKGLYYYCDEKYSPRHKCTSKLSLLMPDEEEKEGTNMVAEFEHLAMATFVIQESSQELADCGMIQGGTFPKISLHALVGQSNLSTLRLIGKHGNHNLHILVDNGSTHNFLKESIASRLNIPIFLCTPFKVLVGNGQYLVCSKKCESIPFKI
ncbi:hypothetical protein CFOL_v3_21013 [Cephalotus follicularis]|uniref:RVP_2 domain-containing protein n=1 Tax=Cephalotus follicularis TaxID=3775 RepID=A0A1Q3CBQ9_CEPFO|nr:hypothetical protein CFOL_v3_21013 [Cephalotus follicularis]